MDQRINAGCRLHGIKYSIFINGLKKLNLNFNRKILADLAAQEPNSFSEIVAKVKLVIKSNGSCNQLTHSVLDDIDNCSDLQTLENLRVKYFGKNGIITAELKSLSSSNRMKKKNW